MITELSAHNFKSWQDTGKLQFAPLTGFFGANNSGKTSLLQILLLLKQTVRDENFNFPLNFRVPNNSLVNLGDFDTVIHRHDPTLRLSISVSWKLHRQITIRGNSIDSLSHSTSIVKKYSDMMLEHFHYTAGEHDLVIGWTDQGYRLRNNTIDVKPFRCYGVVNPTGPLEEFLPLRNAFEDLFSRVYHLGPLRRDPQHRYNWVSDHPKDVGQHGENMISSLLSSRVRLFSIEEQILKWLQRLELIDSYDLNPTYGPQDYEFLVQQYKDGPKVRFTDVGFGVSQILPVLTLCYYAPEGSILILEQPEAHLHPKVQSELADVLIDVVKNRNIQIILESHSEHLLLRLMRRIAEYGISDEGISADQTAFHFCEIDNGNSKAEQLEVDEYGNISNWPKNFFGDEMGEVAEKTKAEMKRRKANK